MYISTQTLPLNSHKMAALNFIKSFIHMAGRKTGNISSFLFPVLVTPFSGRGKGRMLSLTYRWDFFATSLHLCASNFRNFKKDVKLLQVQQG